MDEFFVKDNDGEKGPFTFEELTDGRLEPDDMVRTPVTGWQKASTIPDFTFYFQTEGFFFPMEANLAGFGIRALAFALDYLLYSLILGIGLYFYITNQPEGKTLDINNLSQYDGVRAVAAFTFVVYNIVCISLPIGATLGQLTCRLVVVDENGNRLTFLRSLVRGGAKLLSFAFFGIGFLSVLFSARKQGFHDAIAKTYVVRKDVF